MVGLGAQFSWQSAYLAFENPWIAFRAPTCKPALVTYIFNLGGGKRIRPAWDKDDPVLKKKKMLCFISLFIVFCFY